MIHRVWGGVQYLLAAMLYLYPHQMAIKTDIQGLPEWFMEDYFRFLWKKPLYFREVSEVDEYWYYIKNLVADLYHNIRACPDQVSSKQMALISVRNFDRMPLLFTKRPLKEIFFQHARLIDFAFRLLGYELDYFFPQASRSGNAKIRLGIFLESLNLSTEVFASLPVFKTLDRDKFEVFLYAYNIDGNPIEQHVRTLVDKFIAVPKDVNDCVRAIRNDDLDALFFGNSALSETSVTSIWGSHRLARKQFVHFCQPCTTGLRHVDYFIIGSLIDPEDKANEHFSERLLKIKGSGICFDMLSRPKLPDHQVTRDNFGLPDGGTLFVSGANFFKIIPELRVIWAVIVAAVPDSVLVLYPFGPAWGGKYPTWPFINEMQGIFREHGVSRDRLIILKPFDNRDDIKTFLMLADVYLDAVPYSGATSLLDPLGVGVPPVVMEGLELRFRQGAAMLREIDMTDLIADSEEAYIKLAVRLGTDTDFRKVQSEKIVRKMEQNPPFLDPTSYAEEIGRVLEEMVAADGGLNKPAVDINQELDRAVQYHRDGELEKARRRYERILEISPEHSDALHLLGVVAHQTGNNEAAIRLISRAIQIDPSNPYYYNNLGEALRAQGSLEAAMTSYRKALMLKHDYPEAHKNLAMCFRNKGN